MILEIKDKRIEPDILVLELTGKIILGNDSKRLEWRVDEGLKQDQKKVIFDLAGITSLDSTGIGIIIFCYGKLKAAGGGLRVAGAQGVVGQTLKLTNIDTLVGTYASVTEAAQGF
ncbi:MAG TPA: STAS domain-containing protein [Candidatus Xenobia bacterium]|nr:STAS domain-containing protein [Candidatus Xenobia bacterium]